MKEILIWSDYACPFCYIGEKRLKDAISDLGLEKEFNIVYKAFQLNRDAPLETPLTIPELLAKKYNLTMEEAIERVKAIDRMGKDVGLDFRYETARSSNTLDAHRLMKYVEKKGDQKMVEALNEALFAAYFTDNRNLANHEVLMQLAVNVGMRTEETSRVLNSKDYTDAVRHDENEAAALGIRGVPYIVFEGKIAVPGAVSTEEFKEVIRHIMNNEDIKSPEDTQVCDNKGCKI